MQSFKCLILVGEGNLREESNDILKDFWSVNSPQSFFALVTNTSHLFFFFCFFRQFQSKIIGQRTLKSCTNAKKWSPKIKKKTNSAQISKNAESDIPAGVETLMSEVSKSEPASNDSICQGEKVRERAMGKERKTQILDSSSEAALAFLSLRFFAVSIIQWHKGNVGKHANCS